MNTTSLVEALTTHEYDDVVGHITRNVADGLFAIATAVNRLAAANERMVAAQEAVTSQLEDRRRELERLVDSVVGVEGERGGHA